MQMFNLILKNTWTIRRLRTKKNWECSGWSWKKQNLRRNIRQRQAVTWVSCLFPQLSSGSRSVHQVQVWTSRGPAASDISLTLWPGTAGLSRRYCAHTHTHRDTHIVDFSYVTFWSTQCVVVGISELNPAELTSSCVLFWKGHYFNF